MILAAFGYLWLVVYWFIYYTPQTTEEPVKQKPVSPWRLLRSRFVIVFTLAKTFMDPVWYFVTFWIGRYLVDVHHWDLKQIGWFATIPFIIADAGNLVGGYFTQYIIKKGVAIPAARRLAITLAGLIMGISLLAGPLVISSPLSALLVFGFAGFGYTAFTANALAVPADVVPQNAAASVWGMACVGTGLGGALFQALSGLTLKTYAGPLGYHTAYNLLFFGFGALALIGLAIMLIWIGPFVKNEALTEPAE